MIKDTNMATDTFTLDEGTIALQYPASLSPESFDDLDAWLKLQIKKIKRGIKVKEESPKPSLWRLFFMKAMTAELCSLLKQHTTQLAQTGKRITVLEKRIAEVESSKSACP